MELEEQFAVLSGHLKSAGFIGLRFRSWKTSSWSSAELDKLTNLRHWIMFFGMKFIDELIHELW